MSEEPMERLEEFLFHPADKTFDALHLQSTLMKKELTDERRELEALMAGPIPSPEREKRIQEVKRRVMKKHDALMDILKMEEKISRES